MNPMKCMNWQRLSLLFLGAGMLALSPGVWGQDQKQAAENTIKKTDVHGDPLPEGARARMGTLRWRHPTTINFVGFTAQNKHVVTACADEYFRVWDAETGKEIRKFGKPANVMMPKGGQFLMRRGVRVVSYGMGSNVLLSADGKVLVETGLDGIVRLWDVAGGKEIRTIGNDPKKEDKVPQGFPPGPGMRMGMPIGVSSLALSPDGKTLATKGFDQVIRLWDTGTGKEVRQIGKPPQQNQQGGFEVPAYAGNGGNLAFLGDGKGIVSMGMELDNQRQASVLRIYDVESGKELRHIKSGQQNFFLGSGLAVLPKSKTIAWAGSDGTIGLYDADSGKEIRRIGQQQQNAFTRTVLISPDGKVMATQKMNMPAIHLWDVESGKELRILGERPANQQAIFVGGFGIGGINSTTIAFSSDSKTMAEATAGNTIRLWKVETGKEMAPVSSGHHGDVNRLAVSADGKTLTTFAGDHTIRQWDMASGKELRQVKLPAGVSTIALSSKLAVWNSGNRITLWDVDKGKELRTIDMPAQQQQQIVFFPGMGMNGSLTLSPQDKLIAIRGADQVIRMYDTGTGKEVRQLVEQEKPAPNPNGGGGFIMVGVPFGGNTPMAFSADGTAFAAVSNYNGPQLAPFPGGGQMPPGSSLRLWNLTHGKQPRIFDAQQKTVIDLAVTPDGRNVVTANADSTLSIWESLTGKECMTIKLNRPEDKGPKQPQPPQAPAVIWAPMMAQTSFPTSLAISPDGRTLALGTDRGVHLWDLRTGKEIGQFKGHQGSVMSVAFAPDNQTIITGSADTTALVWDAGKFIKKTATIELKAEQVDELWKDLAGDQTKAYQAITTLITAPKQAVDLFKTHIKPAVGGDEQRIQKLIGDLESDKFQTRQAATKELEKLGELAEPALQKAMQTLKALEAKRRVEKLLANIANDQVPSGEVLRTLRAVQVLGQIGTPQARTELERLAGGAPGDKLTRSAETALRRLKKES
jgi:WD40 repeat protein